MGNYHHKGLCIALILFFIAVHPAKSQTAKQVFSNSGIWQDYGIALSAKAYPEFKGRLVNVSWSEIETAPDTWDWTIFDTDINQHVIDSLPVIVLVYTGMNAPNWIYSNGVPKVIETDSDGNSNTYSPYYLSNDYNVYFKRMITNVRQHIESMPSSVRNKIIGIQGCYGSTGDQIAYKGTVPDKYAITTNQFDSLFKVYSTCYYNEYKDLVPKIALLSNPYFTDSIQANWLLQNCPGGWLKCGTLAKGSQLNFELDKNQWLYDVLNKPSSGQYVQARCEVVGGVQLNSGWWTKNRYKEMFGIMCYCIYWGLDWPNETPDFIQNSKFDSAFAFFNKYAGQKVAGTATNAVCALKDVLDASDTTRFPSALYGNVDRYNTARYKNIYNSFSAYGAKLEDISVVTGSEYASLSASGTNDVGWRLLPGNYERFLHQINANATSAGYWNVDDAHNEAMYGRYGRGFDVANNKNILYFDVEDNFFRNQPLNAAYPVTIEVTYFDSGTGSWRLLYDSKTIPNKIATTVVCTNTGTWKKATIKLSDANFGNMSSGGSDFYIKNAGTQNVIFSTVELSRPLQSDAGLIVTALPAFDSVCINSITSPKSFVINGASLNGAFVQVGPLNGFKFSTSGSGTFSNSLTLKNYGQSLNITIYVKQNTAIAANFSGNIPISGGGFRLTYIKATSTIVNSNPLLDATVSLVSCNNQKDGAIDLQPQNGTRPFTYKWTNDVQKSWSDTNEDISGLQPGNYTVVVNSGPGCSTSKTYTITQPEPLSMSVSADSAIQCAGGSTTVTVTAYGGISPYTGTGVFTVGNGFQTYYISDANGCQKQLGLRVENGNKTTPPKPDGINGPGLVSILQANLKYSVKNSKSVFTYTWSVPDGAQILSGQNTKSITVIWGLIAGTVSVKAANICGESNSVSQKVGLLSGITDGNTNSMVAKNIATDKIGGNKEIIVLPNPVNTVATLSFYAPKSYTYNIKINDISGRVLLLKDGIAAFGANLVKLDVSHFTAGTYYISLLNKEGESKTVKMIKQL